MLRYFLKNNQFHYELKSGLLEDRADGYAVGDYKKRPNMIAIYQTVRHENVEQEMCLPMDWYSSIIVSSPGKRKEGFQIRKKNKNYNSRTSIMVKLQRAQGECLGTRSR